MPCYEEPDILAKAEGESVITEKHYQVETLSWKRLRQSNSLLQPRHKMKYEFSLNLGLLTSVCGLRALEIVESCSAYTYNISGNTLLKKSIAGKKRCWRAR